MSLIVDVHSHIIPEAAMGTAGPHGPEFRLTESGSWMMRNGSGTMMLHAIAHSADAAGKGGDEDPREWGDRLSNPLRRLREMDDRGFDAMVVSPSPPLYMYDIEPEHAVPYTRAYNDALAEYCSADPRRLYFLATLPLQDTKAAVEETARTIKELGARGVYVGATNLGGHELDDPELFPLYEELVAADLPLSIHPGGLGKRELLGLPNRMREGAALGFPMQETHAQFVLVAGGVFDAFPALKVAVSHGGGFFPYQFSRIEEFLKLEGSKRIAKKPVEEYFQNLYYDLVLHDVRSRRLLIDVAGSDHVMLGSNYAGMDSVDGLALIDELELPEKDRRRITGENAASLYKLALN